MSENKAVQNLDGLYRTVKDKPNGSVMLAASEAAELLDYIESLENNQGDEIKVGDKVKTQIPAATVKGGIPEGSVGEVIHINHLSTPYPYEIRFNADTSAMYGFHELKKEEG